MFSLLSPLCVLPGYCVEWQVGGGVNLYGAAGNLDLAEPGVDVEIFLGMQGDSGGVWRACLDRFAPQLDPDEALTSADMTTAWLLRGADVRFRSFTTTFNAGMGIGWYHRESEERSVTVGSVGFRADILMRVYSLSAVTFNIGISYRGSPIPDTGCYNDRIGLTAILVGHP